MKLTVQLKLKPTPHQADALKRTLEAANAACNYISQAAWESTTFRQFAIHRLTYQAVRNTFGLSAHSRNGLLRRPNARSARLCWKI